MKKLFRNFAPFTISVLLVITSQFAMFAYGQDVASGSEANVSDEKRRDSIISLDALLDKVKKGRIHDEQVNAERIKKFRQLKSEQDDRLAKLKQEIENAEVLSRTLEESFNKNDEILADLESKLQERLGSIKELFGVLQQVSGDAQAQLSNSITQLHYPERADYLLGFSEKMGQVKILPKISEIERLWFELQREMIASGEVYRFNYDIVNSEGINENRSITRVGLFNLVSDGKYLQFVPETRRVIEFMRQPRSRYLLGAKAIDGAEKNDVVNFSVDPTRGQLLSLFVRAPRLQERIQQGGVIGYIIIALGVFAILLALHRLVVLVMVERKVNKQRHSSQPQKDNPLGRIVACFDSNKHLDHDTLELKVSESILKEVPLINRNLSLLKIIAAIAPLLGLLGTVTGMIVTFQAITLFGAGDPKLMANGISQALVTTVLGLSVAIPTLLLHNIVQTRAKRITDILEHESVAIVAAHAEAALEK